jgi:ADP-dependent NAD(P)H-hydrate dehydratase / NAD(P)H-hydrate epimerase
MKIVTTAQMLKLEAAEMSAGDTAEELMNRAGNAMALRLIDYFGNNRRTAVFLGKGNNAGDGLVVARHLARAGWKVQLNFTRLERDFSPLPARKLAELLAEFPLLPRTLCGNGGEFTIAPEFAIDAMLGLGSTGPLTPEIAHAVVTINQRRRCGALQTIALDLPTGLPHLAEKNEFPVKIEDMAVVADITLPVGFAKEFLVDERWSHWVGRIEVIPLFKTGPEHGDEVLVGGELAALLPRRSARSHKTDYGRVVLFAGSPGLSGAALLTARAALHAGAGMTYLVVPSAIRGEIAARIDPEIILPIVSNKRALRELIDKADAIAVGPGLGTGPAATALVRDILTLAKSPVVVDADALNILAKNVKLLARRKAPTILTPHSGEMERLAGKKFSLEQRGSIAARFSATHHVITVLKGTRTVVANPNHGLAYNTSGNPGLATGGSGDALTGIIAALLGQKLRAWDATRLGVWLHGHAADLALEMRGNCEGMVPSDIINCLPAAFLSMRRQAETWPESCIPSL